MILIDDRAGSKELAKGIPKSQRRLCRLTYGDVAFVGYGPEGPVPVGIEYKTLGDALQSLTSGRLQGHQLPGMLETYAVSYLLIEGRFTVDPANGLLQHRRGKDIILGPHRFSFRDLHNWLTTLEATGIHLRRSVGKIETYHTITGLYRWWTKRHDRHKGHQAFYDGVRNLMLVRPGLKQRVAAQLPGIGWERSSAVSRYFTSVMEMVLAEPEEWMEIDGIGKGISNRVVEELRK